MARKTDKECRQIFKDLIKSLSERNSFEMDNVYQVLEDLYHTNQFRHYYSDIFSVLTTIKKNSTDNYNLEFLGLNIQRVFEDYQEWRQENDREIDISDSIKKFYDHVNLDLARILYSDSVDYQYTFKQHTDEVSAIIKNLNSTVSSTKQDVESYKADSLKRYEELKKEYEEDFKKDQNEIQKSKESIKKLNEDYKKLDQNIRLTTTRINRTKKKVENSEKEYIAILGIFAAVVITFVGGIAFSTSVLQNIHQSSIYRIVFICLLIGLVLLNVFFALFYFIERLVKSNDDDKKQRNSFKPFIIINSVMFALILITFVCWRFGCVEQRNNSINAVTVSDSATPSQVN